MERPAGQPLAKTRSFANETKSQLKTEQHNNAIYTWPDGATYEGNRKQGQGVYTWPDGSKYEGTYKDN